MTAEYKVNGAVAVITLDNPPVNGLGYATRSAIVDGIRKAALDNRVKSVVITGAGRAFSGGADIREFNSPKALAEPTLHTVIDTVERSEKPVVAAIHSVCMGGGLELALGCHYRVASRGAQIALPEVKLGLLPGAGGTQRLPRAVGLEAALDMIVSGAAVPSEQLAGTRLFDQLVDGDLMEGAIAFAHRAADARPLPKLRDLKVAHPDHEAVMQAARNRAGGSGGRFPAPLKCVEAVSAAVNREFEEGLKFERALFMELVQTPESKALRHAFFSERAAGKLPDVPGSTPVRALRTAVIAGAGDTAVGIAVRLADAGMSVTMLDTSREALDRGLAAVRRHYEGMTAKGKLGLEDPGQRLDMIRGTLSRDEIREADIVVEALAVDLESGEHDKERNKEHSKEQIFIALAEAARAGAILAATTSSLDVNRIAELTGRPQDVIGLHFGGRPDAAKLVEILRGDKTAIDVLATGMALAKKAKATAVVSRVRGGFISSRMIGQYFRQAGFLVEEGARREQVDKAAEDFGFAMGPFRMGELTGNAIGPADTQRQRRDIGDQEIVERLLFAMVNEGARLLEEGVAIRASDIDVVFLKGYGFPPYRGGPMFYADTMGLRNVLAGMSRYAGGLHGDGWAPSALLARLAAEGGSFN
jgi:3-hydroxyacyl-CoA dehydrogenase